MNDYYDEDAPTKRPEDGESKPESSRPVRGDDLEGSPATKPENDAEDELRRRAPLHYRPADFDDAPTIPCDEGGGSVLARRYHILKQLGQGGMGSVYLAEDLELDKKLFAIKMLPSELVANEAAYRQLKGEALMAMKLVHTNIVQIRAFEENGGNPFIVMDYIEGKTLSACLADWGKLSAEETAALLKPVAAAIDYAHSQKVVHRDIKPGNVLIRNDGVPFVLDFGIAREIRETMTRVTGRSSGGTLLYMSPEQLHGRAPKPAQDVYSFAAMAYECMKGEPPFVRGQVEYQIDNDPPEPLPEGTPIAAGVMAGLAKKPEDRPASCMAVIEGNGFGRAERAEHVEGVLGTGDGGQPAAQQPPADEIYVKPVKPKTGLLLAGAAALAVAVLGGWYGWTKHDEDQRRRAGEARRAYDEKVAKLESEKRLSDSAKAAAEAERAKLAAENKRIESEKSAAEAEELIKKTRIICLNVTPEGKQYAGITVREEKGASRSYYLEEGQERDGWTLISMDVAARTAKVKKDGVEALLSMDSPGQATGRAAAENEVERGRLLNEVRRLRKEKEERERRAAAEKEAETRAAAAAPRAASPASAIPPIPPIEPDVRAMPQPARREGYLSREEAQMQTEIALLKAQLAAKPADEKKPAAGEEAKAAADSVKPAPADDAKAAQPEYKKYTVQEGEDLYAIAIKARVAVNKLRDLNSKLLHGDTFDAGTTILLPPESNLE